jgi:hypothetical protein
MYPLMLAMAIYNEGDAVNPQQLKRKWNNGSFLANINLNSCYTTNYDSVCERFFNNLVKVIHLHGSMHDNPSKIPTDKEMVEIGRSLLKSHASNLVLGIEDKNINAQSEKLVDLSGIQGTLLVFGFSGDYDNHITRRIQENSRIKNIVYFQHGLEEKLDKSQDNEQFIKLEAFLKFQAMRKDVLIVDSNRFFE